MNVRGDSNRAHEPCCPLRAGGGTLGTFFLAAVVLCGVSTGCGDEDAAASDGGALRGDAMIVEAGPQPDASVDAYAVRDGAVPAADAAAATCPAGVCDPIDPEDSCGGEGSCRVAADGPMCTDGLGPVEEGGFCIESSDCAMGLACFGSGVREGVCARPCCPGSVGCGPGQECVGAGVLMDGSDTGWWRCASSRPCDLFPMDACSPGEACYIVSEVGETECRKTGTAEVGDACVDQNDCAAGLFCGGLSGATCVRICRLRVGASDCPDGEGVCRAYPHTPDGSGLCTPETAGAGR